LPTWKKISIWSNAKNLISWILSLSLPTAPCVVYFITLYLGLHNVVWRRINEWWLRKNAEERYHNLTEVLPQDFLCGTEEIHEKPESGRWHPSWDLNQAPPE
jgi:hypothetical protein